MTTNNGDNLTLRPTKSYKWLQKLATGIAYLHTVYTEKKRFMTFVTATCWLIG